MIADRGDALTSNADVRDVRVMGGDDLPTTDDEIVAHPAIIYEIRYPAVQPPSRLNTLPVMNVAPSM